MRADARFSIFTLLAAVVGGCSTMSEDAGGGQCEIVPSLPPYADIRYLDVDTPIIRQGAAIRVTPRRDRRPAGVDDLPLECLRNWSVQGPARLDPRTGTLTIDPAAAAGAEVTVAASLQGERLTRTLRVVARDAVVLTGTRGQKSVSGCGNPDPVRELEFGAEGRFSVTFMPFESYRDYWGTYTYDPATQALAMRVEGGNFVPEQLDLEGRAWFDSERRLIIEDVYFGSRNRVMEMPACRYVF